MITQNPYIYGFTEGFTDPFRYAPHPFVRKAAGIVMERVQRLDEIARAGFEEGKMMGILIVGVPEGISDFTDWLDEERRIGFLAGFSGAVAGTSHIDGFVPPIFDLYAPDGEYRLKEAEISGLNHRISALEGCSSLAELRLELTEAERVRDEEIRLMKARMAVSKRERDQIRCELSDPNRLGELVRESQFEKAELRRLKLSWEGRISEIRMRLDMVLNEISGLKAERSAMSDRLQRWIFEQYVVYNALGERVSVWELFTGQELVPPGGTGDCAAPKLLNHAYLNGFVPLAMGEFWYGRASVTAVRCHGHFYPSCTSKCGPLLKFMMKGLEGFSFFTPSPSRPAKFNHEIQSLYANIKIIYEDSDIIVVEKAPGMPSVPGLDGRESVLERLNSIHANILESCTYEAVHRLDMDTSGVMVFAKNGDAAVNLRRQFEEHRVRKTYMARLLPADKHGFAEDAAELKAGDSGRIELPLSADYDERPRQNVDFTQGKSTVTDYEIAGIRPDGCIDIIFHPVTGRTHQLRVHSAHSLGLARPILGDMLYGGFPACPDCPDSSDMLHSPARLHLHALSITFRHPDSGKEMTFTSSLHSF